MTYQNLIKKDNLPKELSEFELKKLLKLAQNGDKLAREKIIIHNLRIVLDVINESFLEYETYYDDLISCGMLGITKAIDCYKENNKSKLITFIRKQIKNQMANLINQERYYLKNEGLHALGLNPHLVIDPLTDVEQSYLDSESRKEVWQLVENLPSQSQEIIKFYFKEGYTMDQIGEVYGVSGKAIGRRMETILNLLEKQLTRKKLIVNYKLANQIPPSRKRKKRDIYKILYEYSSLNIDEALNYLTLEEIDTLLYTDNLTIITKLRGILEKMKQDVLANKDNSKITHQDYQQILELMKMPYFYKLSYFLGTKELIVLLLKLGLVNDKIFTTEAIGNFFNITKDEVSEIIKKIFLDNFEIVDSIDKKFKVKK